MSVSDLFAWKRPRFKHDEPTRRQLKAKLDRTRARLDASENIRVRARSGGRCEIVVNGRCRRPASEVHHMIGKWRLRGRNESALAERKQDACQACHRDITEHRLRRIGGEVPHFTDTYWRPR